MMEQLAENSKKLLEQIKDGEFTVVELGHRTIHALMLVAAVAFVLGQLMARSTSKAVVTYGPTVRRTLGNLLELLAGELKPRES